MPRTTRKLAAVAMSAAAMMAATTSVASAVAPPQDTPQSFSVDSRSQYSTGSPHDLLSNKYYFVTVSGVVSYYGQAIWTGHKAGRVICGTTQAITDPSQGQGAGVGGTDAEFLFAGTATRGCGNPRPPFAWGGLTASTNGGWNYSNLTPMGAALTQPTSNHSYTYLVKGSGNELRFKFNDVRYSDNNGKLSVNLRRATSNDCKSGGWKDFGVFRSQNDCSSNI